MAGESWLTTTDHVFIACPAPQREPFGPDSATEYVSWFLNCTKLT